MGVKGVGGSKEKLLLLSFSRAFIWCLYVWRCLCKECGESAGISFISLTEPIRAPSRTQGSKPLPYPSRFSSILWTSFHDGSSDRSQTRCPPSFPRHLSVCYTSCSLDLNYIQLCGSSCLVELYWPG